jgi:hypothetical protein
MTTPAHPTWESHLAHYAGDVISAVGQSPAAIHAFISAFTSHPDPSGTATRPGAIAAVVIILAVIVSLVGWMKSKTRSRSA